MCIRDRFNSKQRRINAFSIGMIALPVFKRRFEAIRHTFELPTKSAFTISSIPLSRLLTFSASIASSPISLPFPTSVSYTHLDVYKRQRLLFPKGKDVKNEIEIAQRKWNFNFEIEVFDKNSGSCILEISELERAK